MLFWEVLQASRLPRSQGDETKDQPGAVPVETVKLPFDRRCCAKTKSGGRCRGRIIANSEYCLFHDPAIAAKRRSRSKASNAAGRRKLSQLPDGYLRKLTSISAVGEAMDRLYREVRLGVMTPEMGDVLFKILTRLVDGGLVQTGAMPERTKAARIRPKLRDLLTRSERMAWNRATARAVAKLENSETKPQPTRPLPAAFDRVVAQRSAPRSVVPLPAQINFPAAS